jgi:uncharacterized coiled-coil protein SlyX
MTNELLIKTADTLTRVDDEVKQARELYDAGKITVSGLINLVMLATANSYRVMSCAAKTFMETEDSRILQTMLTKANFALDCANADKVKLETRLEAVVRQSAEKDKHINELSDECVARGKALNAETDEATVQRSRVGALNKIIANREDTIRQQALTLKRLDERLLSVTRESSKKSARIEELGAANKQLYKNVEGLEVTIRHLRSQVNTQALTISDLQGYNSRRSDERTGVV